MFACVWKDKKIGNDNELIIESDVPVLDGEIEQQNKNAIEQFILTARQSGQRPMSFSYGVIALIFFLLFVAAFLIPSGVVKFLFAFVLLIVCYASLRMITSIRKKRRVTEMVLLR